MRTLSEAREVDLAEFDVVHMRQDPPFDMTYITITHMLEHIHPKTLVVNDPAKCAMRPKSSMCCNTPSTCRRR
jgi:glutathione synthase